MKGKLTAVIKNTFIAFILPLKRLTSSFIDSLLSFQTQVFILVVKKFFIGKEGKKEPNQYYFTKKK